MAYEKTTWSNGATPLSAENMNHIEEGIAALDQDLQTGMASVQSSLTALSIGKVDKVSGKGLSTNDYTTAEKNKLAGIASGAEVNVQSDWNQTATTADSYIKNKPGNASTSAAGLMSASDKSKLNSMPSFVAGSHVYSANASGPGEQDTGTDLITFSDSNLIGKTYIICGTQDSGNPPLRASLTSSTGRVTVYLADPVTVMRVNYIAW